MAVEVKGGGGGGVISGFHKQQSKINSKAQCVRFTGLQWYVMKLKIHMLVSGYI